VFDETKLLSPLLYQVTKKIAACEPSPTPQAAIFLKNGKRGRLRVVPVSVFGGQVVNSPWSRNE
jgi:hypothetical protein